MDTRTGEIKMFGPGEAIPQGHVELGRLPNPDCKICKGFGKTGPKIVGHKHRRQFVYVPCKCTEPVEAKPDNGALRAMGAFGELHQKTATQVALVGAEPDSQASAVAAAMSHARTTEVIVLP